MLSAATLGQTGVSSLKVSSVDETEWNNMADDWRRLLIDAGCDTLFLQHAWLSTWWHSYRHLYQARLFIVVVRDANGRLVGGAPFFLNRVRHMGCPQRVLQLLGQGQSDRLDLPVLSTAVASALVDYLTGRARQWDAIELKEIDPAGSFMRYATQHFGAHFKESSVADSVCSWIEVEGEWQTFYESAYKGQKRKKINSEWRQLNAAFPVSIRFITDLAAEPGILEILADIERDHPGSGAARPGAFNDPGLGGFLRALAPTADTNNWLMIAVLRCADVDAAYQFWFRHNGRYCGYAMAYRAAYAEYGVGKLLLLRSLEYFWNTGAQVIDFLRGGEEYKRRLATHEQENRQLSYVSPAWRGYLQYRLRDSTAPWLARRLPALHRRLTLADRYGWRCALGLRSLP